MTDTTNPTDLVPEPTPIPADHPFSDATFEVLKDPIIRGRGHNPPTNSAEFLMHRSDPQNLLAQQAPTQSSAPSLVLPSKVDNSAMCGPVLDQGSCGSCVAFGVTRALEIGIACTEYISILMSPQFLWDCGAIGTYQRNCSNGWWVEEAARFLSEFGMLNKAQYELAAEKKCDKAKKLSGIKLDAVRPYEWIFDVPAMKAHLSTRGALVGVFNIYTDFYYYGGGVYRRTKKPTNQWEGSHCVAIIGYDDAQQCWLCVNSWGTYWGERGFFRIGYGECNIDSVMWKLQYPTLIKPGYIEPLKPKAAPPSEEYIPPLPQTAYEEPPKPKAAPPSEAYEPPDSSSAVDDGWRDVFDKSGNSIGKINAAALATGTASKTKLCNCP